jgi:hypothetical protein
MHSSFLELAIIIVPMLKEAYSSSDLTEVKYSVRKLPTMVTENLVV